MYAPPQVFIAISLILGDGLYNLIKIILITGKEVMNARSKQDALPIVATSAKGKHNAGCGAILLLSDWSFYTHLSLARHFILYKS